MDIIFLIWILIFLSGLSILLLLKFIWRSSKKIDDSFKEAIRYEFNSSRSESAQAARDLRMEVSVSQKSQSDTMVKTMSQMAKLQIDHLEVVSKQIKELIDSNEIRNERIRNTIDIQLKRMQESNEKKLDQMRQTVDEKLQNTLEKRLGESFKLVSDNLEAVHRGLGEMKNLAVGVGDLKRVLTNVKIRGIWGEVQLGAILEQILTPDQYDKNVQIKENSREAVEFAIRLPGFDNSSNSYVWLPIDSKFPHEDYLRLVDAAEIADTEAIQKYASSLIRGIQNSAKDIFEKYIDPPRTTDFAILFLPTEGLYAEVLRQPGQIEQLQEKYRVIVAGPTTLSAILNSLRMGFQTVAIEKRSNEVWNILSGVKTEFGRFGKVLDKVKKQLNVASNTIASTSDRTKAMVKKLRDVEQLPGSTSADLFGFSENKTDEINDCKDK